MIQEITSFFDGLEPLTTKLIGALLILFIGLIIGRISGVLLKRVLHSINTDKNVRRVLNVKLSFEKLLSQILSWLVYVATIIMALNHLGLTTAILTIITAVLIIILALSLLLAVRDMLPNLFAGITIKYRRDFAKGDRIKVKNVDGVVEEINLLSTKVSLGTDLIVLPNSIFQKEGYQVKKKK
jgi:small-conductance mechanosensitive channel